MPALPMPASSKVHWRRRCGRTRQPRQDRRAELQSRMSASRPQVSRYTSALVRSVTANPRLPSFSGVGTASCKADRIRGAPGRPLCRHCFRTERRRSGRASSTSRRNSPRRTSQFLPTDFAVCPGQEYCNVIVQEFTVGRRGRRARRMPPERRNRCQRAMSDELSLVTSVRDRKVHVGQRRHM